jgi:ligand-binding SRPBCC domain-containing protein
MPERFRKETAIEAAAELVFAWHERPEAFGKLTPPWERVRVVERSGEGLETGTRVVLEMRVGPFRQRWVALHTAYEKGRMFRDEQVSGPFARWVHSHRVEPVAGGRSRLVDEIDYALPFGWLGRLFGGGLMRRKLERMFEYRHRVTKEECERQAGRSRASSA